MVRTSGFHPEDKGSIPFNLKFLLNSLNLIYISPPNTLTAFKTSRVSLNYSDTRRFIFLFFLTIILTFTAVLSCFNLPRSGASAARISAILTVKRVNCFWRTNQKAPMAHRQYSQDQYGFFYYKLTTSLRLISCLINNLRGCHSSNPLTCSSRLLPLLPQNSTASLKLSSIRVAAVAFIL